MTAVLIVVAIAAVLALFVAVGVVARRRRASAPEVETAAPTQAKRSEGSTVAVSDEAPVLETPPEPEVVDAAPVEVSRPVIEVPVAPPTLRERLGKARGLFSGAVGSARGKGAVAASFDELEEALLRADVGVSTTTTILDDLRKRAGEQKIRSGDELIEALREDLVTLLAVEGDGGAPDSINGSPGRSLRFDDEPGVVNVWLFVGVNGVGKTTTIGKVARQESTHGRSVLLAAGDTFRAAAGEQLATWAERSNTEIVRGAEGGDPSAIVFDAVQRAAARGKQLVLADTAGRLHTKSNLIEELKKIRRVADREPGRVTEVLLVLDATTGQNGLVQAREFTEAVDVTGVVLTKLDGTARGGIVISVHRELGLPVKLVGLGEGVEDLIPFEPAAFVDALLD